MGALQVILLRAGLTTLRPPSTHIQIIQKKGYSDYPIKSDNIVPAGSDEFLVANAAPAANLTGYQDAGYENLYNADRALPVQDEQIPYVTLFGEGRKYSLEKRIEDKKRGVGRQRYPVIVWIMSIALTAVIIYELVLNGKHQGTPFSFKPTVNPMLGPSSSALIYAGARFPPCMKIITDIPLDTSFACMNDTANPPDRLCSIESICGFGGFHGKSPNQAFRFVTPVFLHAGLVHILLNVLALLTASADIEREMGSLGFLITYMAAGIFGNVLGGNFARPGIPSTGASGAIFGIMAVEWADLFFHWRYIYRPGRRLIFLIINLIIGIAMGFIPYVDNFAHLGGFLMGLLIGTIFYPVISTSDRHKMFAWGCKIVALPLAIVLFVVLTRNFYTSDPYKACTWCRYLSCIPMSSNSYCKGTGLTIVNTSN